MKLRTYLAWVPTIVLFSIVLLMGYATVIFRKGVIPHPFLLPLATYLVPITIFLFMGSLLVYLIGGKTRRLLNAMILLGVTVLGGLIIFPFFSVTTMDRESDTFRVGTWNVFRCYHGESQVRETIRKMDADILAVQEVVDSERNESDEWQLDRITTPLGYDATFVGYRDVNRDPLAGIAICVREPVTLLSVDRRTYHPEGEWRYAFAEVSIDNDIVNIVIPHFYPFALETTLDRAGKGIASKIRGAAGRIWRTTYWHRQESEELMRIVSTFKDPTIILGDFNSTPTHPIHWRLRTSLIDCLMAAGRGLTPTFVFFLPIRIDYIYVTPTIHVHNARVISTSGSDHRPVIADLSLSPTP